MLKSKQILTGLLLSLIFFLLFLSCIEENKECQPKLYKCLIRLINQDGESVIGTNKIYSPDTVKMIINDRIWTADIDSNGIYWDYSGLDYLNTTNYYLYLNFQETDTLNFKIGSTPGECFNTYRIDTFYYNFQIIEPNIPINGSSVEYVIYK